MDTKSPASVEEAEKAKKQAYEDKWDMIYMTSAVILTVLVITSSMVSRPILPARIFSDTAQIFVAYLAGARFDIAYYEIKDQVRELLGWAEPKVIETVKVVTEKSEL